MMVISLAIGVVLIAGVVTPILASTISTSGGGGGSATQEVEFTNDGMNMTEISDIFSSGQRYEIRKMATPTSTALYEYTIYNGDTVVRTEPITTSDTKTYTILANSEVLIQYKDHITSPQLVELTILLANDPNSPYTVSTNDASDFALVIGKTGNTDVFSITFNNSGVTTHDITARDGFVVDTEGDWAMISAGEDGTYPVKYLDVKNVYSLSSYGVYWYQGGTDSAIATFVSDLTAFSDVTTTGFFGQTDVDGHKEFTASFYVEVDGQPQVGTEPHGMTFTATAQMGEITMSCDSYIVPATGKATVEVPSSITNEGLRMSAFDDVIEKYDIRSVYVTEGDSTWADVGSRFLTFYNDNGTLKMGIKTYGDSENTTEEITSITESCILLSVPDHLIIYNSDRDEILYACTDMPVNLRSDSVSSLMDFNIGYDYARGSTEPALQYSMVIGQYAGGGEFTSTEGYLYDTEGDYVSSYGQNPIYYEGNSLIYGFINERNPQGSNLPIIAYMSTGMLMSYDDYETPVVTDNHTTKYGFNYVDSNNTITVDLNNTSQSEEYTETCNVFIAPRTIGSEGGSGGGVSGSLASMISVIPLIMAVGLVIGAIQYIKMKN